MDQQFTVLRKGVFRTSIVAHTTSRENARDLARLDAQQLRREQLLSEYEYHGVVNADGKTLEAIPIPAQ